MHICTEQKYGRVKMMRDLGLQTDIELSGVLCTLFFLNITVIVAWVPVLEHTSITGVFY